MTSRLTFFKAIDYKRGDSAKFTGSACPVDLM
jgi:hypothetical protein